MRFYTSHRNILWTVLFSILAALSLNACSDISKAPAPEVPLSPDAKLSSLTVNPGGLAPAFSGDVINYTVDVGTSRRQRHGDSTTTDRRGHDNYQWPGDNEPVRHHTRSRGLQYADHRSS